MLTRTPSKPFAVEDASKSYKFVVGQPPLPPWTSSQFVAATHKSLEPVSMSSWKVCGGVPSDASA